MTKQKKVIILLPSDRQSGPVLGGIALANNLIKYFDVSLVYIKSDNASVEYDINSGVNAIYLNNDNLFLKYLYFRRLMHKISEGSDVLCISMCFMPDMFNVLKIGGIKTCASVRANHFENYKNDYGLLGYICAVIHNLALNFMTEVVVMNKNMLKQISPFVFKKPIIIGNFIDESHILRNYDCLHLNLENFESAKNSIRFVFVGSLTKRKQPLLLLQSFSELINQGLDVYLDIVGSGPLESAIKTQVNNCNLQQRVNVYGELKSPFDILKNGHVFVLPSKSEGTSRASLEALFFGLPCILRNVDGNSELIEENINGFLFDEDFQLTQTMIKSIELVRSAKIKSNLLPKQNSLLDCLQLYSKLF